MTRYFVRSLGAHLRGGRSLYFLTIFGVALGVASVICIQIINRNALAAFRGGIQAVSGDADFSVLGRTPTFPERPCPRMTISTCPGRASIRPPSLADLPH